MRNAFSFYKLPRCCLGQLKMETMDGRHVQDEDKEKNEREKREIKKRNNRESVRWWAVPEAT